MIPSNLICLVDADILVYEIGSCGQYYEEEDVDKTSLIIRSFDFVAELLDQRIKEICEECWSDQPPVLYLTGSEKLIRIQNKRLRRNNKVDALIKYKPNFRFDVATVKPYKGNRKDVVKPFHTDNIIAYMMANYEVKIANGYEADDAIIIDTMADLDGTVVCTRDKDLRQAGKYHYGWACGKQEQFGPKEIDSFGEIILSANKKGIKGEGVKFFYSQLLTGDTTDNIPGLPGCGPAKAFKLLDELETEPDLFEATKAAYEGKYGEGWLSHINEQADLLWMCRALDEDGNVLLLPKLWGQRDG